MDRYIRIYKESDFDFQYKLDSAHLSTPFKFIFFTTDINDSSYECSFDGENYIRCTRVDENSIVFHIDGGVFECGNLRIRKEYFIDSSSFEDGICNSVDIEKTNIYIIEEGSNANSVVYTGSTLPNFDAMLIEQNVERAILILNQKSDEVDQEMSYVILVKDEMEGLLSYATQWEDRIERIENTYATQSYVVDYVSTHSSSVDLSSYVTYSYLDSKHYLDSVPSEYITQEELSANAYLTQHQSLANYPTFADINNMGYATKSYVQNKIDAIPQPDLSSYATKSYVADYVATYAPEPDLSDYPTYSYTNKNYVTYSYLADTVDDIVAGTVDLSNYVKKQELSDAGYITSIPSEYITQEELSSNAYLTQHQSLVDYATKSYVSDYVATYAPEPDLSAYATKSYVSDYVATYVPQPDLSSYVTKTELSNAGYITYIPDDYITQLELSSNSYATTSYVVDYVSEHGGGSSVVIDENLIPKVNNTYTLGDSTYRYKTLYVSEINNANLYDSIRFKSNNKEIVSFSTAVIKPETNNSLNLGGAGFKFKSTYSYNYYLGDNTEIRDLFPTYSYVNNQISSIEPITYTTTYETTYETISIWYGSYSDYSNLPDHTTYQLYLIQQ